MSIPAMPKNRFMSGFILICIAAGAAASIAGGFYTVVQIVQWLNRV